MPKDKKELKEGEYQEFTFEVPLETSLVHKEIKELSAPLGDKINPTVRKTVAMIGDRFMRGQFFSAVELARSASMWESTLHDVNHMGTTYMNGFRPQPNILYFVGWQDNVQYDHEAKSLSMDIHPKLNTRYGKDWNAFIELCDEAGRTPNVSISFLGKVRQIRASSLPEGSNYSNYGYKPDDMVDYIYDVRPRALSTVLQGLCNDKQGCGIATNNSACENGSCANPPEITPTKENKENAEKRVYLNKRIKKFGGK
jgi:hypothetical protein